MSRIDEALKRAAQSPLAGRASARAVESSLRLAEDFTLNEYPQEGRGAAVRAEPAPSLREDTHNHRERQVPDHWDRATPPLASRGEETHVRGLVGLESNQKLVLGPVRNLVSTEQYRRLAATLHEAQVAKGLKTVMVTSAAPKEGKTLTIVNLALTLSESYGRRVLLVDADLRRPAIHQVLSCSNEWGLRNVLRADHLDRPIVELNPRLSVLPSGGVETNPLAGLSSQRMRTLLEDASARFDWVLLDTPPVGALPDGQVVSKLVHAVVFVIRAGSTPFDLIERAIGEIGRESIIGTVLNGVDQQVIREKTYEYGIYEK